MKNNEDFNLQLELPLGVHFPTIIKPAVDPFWDELEPPKKEKYWDIVARDAIYPKGKSVLEQPIESAPEHLDLPHKANSSQFSIIESAPEQVCVVLEQVQLDTTNNIQASHCVLEQAKPATSGHIHWIEQYAVTRSCKKHWYLRYCHMRGRKIHHIHIPGGNIKSPLAIARGEQISRAITSKKSPAAIRELIAVFKSGMLQTLPG